MDETNILGVCPTCYLVVMKTDKNSLEICDDGTVAYHFDCEPSRIKYMRDNKSYWESQGLAAKELREKWSCSLANLAENIGVSESKLRKYESGKPVTHAKMLGKAYVIYFKLLDYYVKEQYLQK
ncbi:helix-turn-helix domain-containing protein [Paenibacillus odorifer]|uniref:helix-turn-helix domain-containing protein n=1 Tax=Paenibacillus odorifer TaxID=189426 RepID=UPI00096E9992|nr:helix-turn-helix transcriptional regulator [Paenibacillus odorifer]OMD92749.1 hypothetical protein BSK67_18475 [Paenibacillus odorifer]